MKSKGTTMVDLCRASGICNAGAPAQKVLALAPRQRGAAPDLSPCEHRAVSKDGRIICRKIVEGDNAISPSLCLTCPVAAIHCAHLRFSLRQTSPSPLVVRFNGRTEIWGDEPAGLQLARAACAEQVIPIDNPLRCASCVLHQPIQTALPAPRAGQSLGQAPASRPAQPQPRRRVAHGGKVVPFPRPEALAASA